jgi:type II secretory pathway component GspD/PulD (secretin)
MLRIALPLLLLPALAPAQPAVDGEAARVLHFAHASASHDRQEIVNAVRTIAEVQRAIVDNASGVLAVRAAPATLDLAAWVFKQLDRVPGAPAAATMESYQISGESPQVRAFFLAHASSPQEIQEIVNTVRSIAEVPRVSAYNTSPTIILRGSQEQAELAAWVIRNLDKQPGAANEPKPLEYAYNDASAHGATAVRIFRIAHRNSPQALQELVNAVRSIADVQRIMVYNALATVTMRSAPPQVAMAAWLIQELDKAETPARP